MKTTTLSVYLIIGAFIVASCGGQQHEAAQDDVAKGDAKEMSKEEAASSITVTPVTDHHQFSDPKLSLTSPSADDALAAGPTNFEFNVEGEDYELGNQTPDAEATLCANSAKGQHIHYIHNNAPYKAFYTSSFEANLQQGSNVVLTFLSRSYHESIKSNDAYFLHEFWIGEGENPTPFDMEAYHMFYSRPKGTYVGEFTGKVLLDFYLINTTLAEDGNKVRVTINGEHTFTITSWVPHLIEGLPMGENKIQLELIDAEGNPIPGPFNNSGERTFTLEEAPEGDA